MRLVLVRHAAAASGTGWRDDERPLSPTGEAEARRVGAFLARLHWDAPRILSSPKVRAVQTAELVAEAIGLNVRPDTSAALAGGVPVETVEQEIVGSGAGTLFAFTHQPDAGRLLAHLLDPRWRGEIPFPTCGFAIVDLGADPRSHATRGNLIFFGHPALIG